VPKRPVKCEDASPAGAALFGFGNFLRDRLVRTVEAVMKAARPRRGNFAGCILLLCSGLSVLSCSASKPPAQTAKAVPISPKDLAGDWLVETKVPGESIEERLHFAVINGILAGSIIGPDGNFEELARLSIEKDKISWDIESDTQTQRIEATVHGTSMEGTIKVEPRRHQAEESAGGTPSGGSPWSGREGGRRGGRGGGRGGGRHGGSNNQKIKFTAYKLGVSNSKNSGD
jgi:hypothetical protein